MCGIAGFYGSPHWELPRQGGAPQGGMSTAIRHRGPDDWGMYLDGPVGLGHVRLSIIDLSGGKQPMADHSNTLWVSFNGEIFELRGAAGRTDSCRGPVPDQLGHRGHPGSLPPQGHPLRGRLQRRLRLCPVGPATAAVAASPRPHGRPPHLLHGPGWRAALRLRGQGPVPGTGHLRSAGPHRPQPMLHLLASASPGTPWQDIQELPPGHILVAQGSTITVQPYWAPSYPSHPEDYATGSEAELAEQLRALLFDATRIRLRADVPVGAYLSGGLDSSIVAARSSW